MTGFRSRISRKSSINVSSLLVVAFGSWTHDCSNTVTTTAHPKRIKVVEYTCINFILKYSGAKKDLRLTLLIIEAFTFHCFDSRLSTTHLLHYVMIRALWSERAILTFQKGLFQVIIYIKKSSINIGSNK